MVPKMVAVESGGQVCSQSVIHIQQLPWLAVDRLWPWLELAGQFFSLLVQMGKKPLSPLVGALFLVYTQGSFQSGGVFTGWKAMKACMRGCGKSHEPKAQKKFQLKMFNPLIITIYHYKMIKMVGY